MNVADWLAVVIVAMAVSAVAGVFIAALMRAGAREMPPVPGRGENPSPGGTASPAPGYEQETRDGTRP